MGNLFTIGSLHLSYRLKSHVELKKEKRDVRLELREIHLGSGRSTPTDRVVKTFITVF